MGCTRGATVLLAYDPRSATAWLRDLVDAHPSLGLSLCPLHAERTSVPMGWERIDERRPAWQSYEVESPFEGGFEPLSDIDIEPPGRVSGRTAPAIPASPPASTPPVEPQKRRSAPEPTVANTPQDPEIPLAAEVRSRRRAAEEMAFHNGPHTAPESVQLEMSAFAEVDALDEDDTFDVEAWMHEDEAEDNFDEIFGLGASDAPVGGAPFETTDEATATEADAAQPNVVDAQDAQDDVDVEDTDQVDDASDWAASAFDELTPTDNPAPARDEWLADVDDVVDPAPSPQRSDAPAPSAPGTPSVLPVDDEAEISFEEIFPPKVNQPEEPQSASIPPQPPIERAAGATTFSERDRQRSLFGGEDVDETRHADAEDDFERHAAQSKPVARHAPVAVPDTGTTTADREAREASEERGQSGNPAGSNPPALPGPPRMEVRPSWAPTRQGDTSKLHVESSSPLLGRAFGFVQRD